MASASSTQVFFRVFSRAAVAQSRSCTCSSVAGITWKDFAELAKATYVEVATQEFGKRGRPTNVSRTAVLTGLARREVRKAARGDSL